MHRHLLSINKLDSGSFLALPELEKIMYKGGPKSLHNLAQIRRIPYLFFYKSPLPRTAIVSSDNYKSRKQNSANPVHLVALCSCTHSLLTEEVTCHYFQSVTIII